jgi:type I restriction enzyme R subunit
MSSGITMASPSPSSRPRRLPSTRRRAAPRRASTPTAWRRCTDFQRRGIKYDQLTDEQRKQIEEDGLAPDQLDYEVRDIDQSVYNKDTNRHIIRNLMEKGIRDASGHEVGKGIVFARNREHAVILRKVFDEMYPQYGGRFCQVIDNYDPRAEQLIDDFKDPTNEHTVAISVDMLDTGIDIPEVVNLVFAKPVYSKVKFWQMIGRGTRLREDLFGPGKDKTEFRIFDHWSNFDFFDFHYRPVEPKVPKPLMQLVFEARIELAEAAIQAAEPALFDIVADLLAKDINSLQMHLTPVREKAETIKQIRSSAFWNAVTVSQLEDVRKALRDIIHHRATGGMGTVDSGQASSQLRARADGSQAPGRPRQARRPARRLRQFFRELRAGPF